MNKTVLVYGLVGGLLIAALKLVEYRFLVIEHSLEIYAAGLSNREIATKLYVSENTVKTHAASVFEKLNAKRRAQAVQLAKEARLIP